MQFEHLDHQRTVDVFFYGLFMDEALLRHKGVNPRNRRIACVDNFRLLIGARATLVPCEGRIVYGVVFSLTHEEIDVLYAEDSVNMYRPEAISARLSGACVVPALCFNLPLLPSPEERNEQYATKLREVALRIGLPPSYASSIEKEE